MLKKELNNHLNNDNNTHLLYFFKEIKEFRANIYAIVNETLEHKVDSYKRNLEEYIVQRLDEFKLNNNIPYKPNDYSIKKLPDNNYIGFIRNREETTISYNKVFKVESVPQYNNYSNILTGKEKVSIFQDEIEKLLEYPYNLSGISSNSRTLGTQDASPPNINQADNINKVQQYKSPESKEQSLSVYDFFLDFIQV